MQTQTSWCIVFKQESATSPFRDWNKHSRATDCFSIWSIRQAAVGGCGCGCVCNREHKLPSLIPLPPYQFSNLEPLWKTVSLSRSGSLSCVRSLSCHQSIRQAAAGIWQHQATAHANDFLLKEFQMSQDLRRREFRRFCLFQNVHVNLTVVLL